MRQVHLWCLQFNLHTDLDSLEYWKRLVYKRLGFQWNQGKPRSPRGEKEMWPYRTVALNTDILLNTDIYRYSVALNTEKDGSRVQMKLWIVWIWNLRSSQNLWLSKCHMLAWKSIIQDAVITHMHYYIYIYAEYIHIKKRKKLQELL